MGSRLPALRAARRGQLIFLSSVVGFAVRPCLAAYSASKFAVEGIAGALLFELASVNIAVT